MRIGAWLVSLLDTRTGLVVFILLTVVAAGVVAYLLWDVEWPPKSPEEIPCVVALWGHLGHPDRELGNVPGKSFVVAGDGATAVAATVVAVDGVVGGEVLTVIYSVDGGPAHVRAVTRGAELEGVLRFKRMIGEDGRDCRPAGLGGGS